MEFPIQIEMIWMILFGRAFPSNGIYALQINQNNNCAGKIMHMKIIILNNKKTLDKKRKENKFSYENDAIWVSNLFN